MLISRFRSPTLLQKGGGGGGVHTYFSSQLIFQVLSHLVPVSHTCPRTARPVGTVRYGTGTVGWPASAIQAVKSGRQEGSGAVRTIKVRSGVVPEGDSLSVLLRARCCARTLCCKSLRVLYALRPAPLSRTRIQRTTPKQTSRAAAMSSNGCKNKTKAVGTAVGYKKAYRP